MTTETLPRTVPAEPTTPIKPSEAIRLGCLTTAPAFGEWRAADGSVCALGAMQIGFGGKAGEFPWPDAYAAFRDGSELVVPTIGRAHRPGAAVMILNDGDGWSRERIADWLEGLGL